MEFNIVENPEPNFLGKYEEFIELYKNKDYSVREIRKILNYNQTDYNHAKVKAVNEGRITLRKKPNKYSKEKKKRGKFYSFNKTSSKFVITKKLGDKYVYFGSYKSEKTTQEIIKRLKTVNWDKSKLDEIKKVCIKKYGR